MIASLNGTLDHVGLDSLVVSVGGVGLLVHTTAATAAAHRVGGQADLATTLVVREDSLTLYGFASRDERDMFDTVQTVSGVGPRLALAMLSVMGPEDLRRALGEGDVKALTSIPGIGKKSAERLVLELRDKVGIPGVGGAAVARTAADAEPWREQVTQALTGLGWNTKQADEAVAAAAKAAEPGAEVSTYLRLALAELRR